MWKRLLCLLWFGAVSSCLRSAPSIDAVAGVWRATFYTAAPDSGTVVGFVILPQPTCERESNMDAGCTTAFRGSTTIDFAPILGHSLTSYAGARIDSAEREVVMGIGPCCDVGELSLRGRIDGNTFRGEWSETFVSVEHAKRGTFEMIKEGSSTSTR